MSELEMKTGAEAPEFTDELSDEALDRTEREYFVPSEMPYRPR